MVAVWYGILVLMYRAKNLQDLECTPLTSLGPLSTKAIFFFVTGSMKGPTACKQPYSTHLQSYDAAQHGHHHHLRVLNAGCM